MTTQDTDILLSLLDDRIRRISTEVIRQERTAKPQLAPVDSSAAEHLRLSEALTKIMVKEFVSVREAALLLNCSDGHVRNLVNKAQKGKASCPIPFLDLDGVTVFARTKLLEWAAQPKRKLRAVS